MVPALFHNIRKALIPLMHDETYEAMSRVSQMIEDAGYKETDRRKSGNPFKRSTIDSLEGAVDKTITSINNDEQDTKDTKRIKLDDNSNSQSQETMFKQTFDAVMNGEVQCTGDYCAPCFELV